MFIDRNMEVNVMLIIKILFFLFKGINYVFVKLGK